MTLTERIARKMSARRRLGWFDWCSDSYDMRVASARAYRITQRLRGVRITMHQAMWD